MKVYELISALSNMPAGAEVQLRCLLDMDDLNRFDTEDIDGALCKNVRLELTEVALIHENLVAIYK